MSPDELTPIKPNFRGEPTRLGKNRPDTPPLNRKDFRNLVKNEDEREPDEELVVEDKEVDDTFLSPFELAAKKTAKKPAPPLPEELAYVAQTPKQPTVKKDPAVLFSEGDEEKIAAFYESDAPEQPIVDNSKLAAKPSTDMEEQSIFTVKQAPEQPIEDPLLTESSANSIKPKAKLSPDFEREIPQDPKIHREALNLDTDATVPAPKKDKLKLNTTRETAFSHENTDISRINPHAFQAAPVSSDAVIVPEEPKFVRSAVNDIVAQMVKELQVVEKGGKVVDTIVRLQYPPLFAEATITLTTLEGRKEFNLAFANLSDEAKVFLDKRIVEDSLVETLARHDITIRHLVTTTLPEANVNVDIEQRRTFAREEREEQRGQQGQNPFEDET